MDGDWRHAAGPAAPADAARCAAAAPARARRPGAAIPRTSLRGTRRPQVVSRRAEGARGGARAAGAARHPPARVAADARGAAHEHVGPAIRVLEMARALSRTARVTVCAPAPLEVRDDRVALVPFDPARPTALKAQAETADALIVQGFALTSYPFLTALVCPIVADLYCPFTIEHLEQHRAAGAAVPPSHEPTRPRSLPCRMRNCSRPTTSSAPASGNAISGSARCTPPAGSTRAPSPAIPTCDP